MDIKKILVPVDIAHSSDLLADYAGLLAKKLDAGLIVMYVAPDVNELKSLHVPHISLEKVKEEILDSAEAEISAFCDTNFKDIDHEVIIRTGSAYREINNSIPELKIDLIIMGTHGTGGLEHFFFGSTAERVLRGAPCPVLTVKLA